MKERGREGEEDTLPEMEEPPPMLKVYFRCWLAHNDRRASE